MLYRQIIESSDNSCYFIQLQTINQHLINPLNMLSFFIVKRLDMLRQQVFQLIWVYALLHYLYFLTLSQEGEA